MDSRELEDLLAASVYIGTKIGARYHFPYPRKKEEASVLC